MSDNIAAQGYIIPLTT